MSRNRTAGKAPAWELWAPLAAVICALTWLLLRGCEPEASESPPEPAPHAQPEGGQSAIAPFAQVTRVHADSFPDGRVWLRTVGSAQPEKLSCTWASSDARSLRPAVPVAPDLDGWWKVEVPATALERSESLVVSALGYQPHWILTPDVASHHEVQLKVADGLIELVDVETGGYVTGAGIRFSSLGMHGEEWEEAPMIPGKNPGTAVLYAEERVDAPGRYLLPANPTAGDYSWEIRHRFYAPAKCASPKVYLGRGAVRVLVQMPVVASIEYVEDEILTGRIGLEAKGAADERAIEALRRWRRDIAEAHPRALTVLFMRDADAESGLLHEVDKATALCTLKHGEQRCDRIDVVPLSRFSGPTMLHASRIADAVALQKVKLNAPPKIGDYEAAFKVIVNGGLRGGVKVMEFGEEVLLPPGAYQILGYGDWAFGAIERTKFVVDASGPVDVDVKWREGIHLYVLQTSGVPGAKLVQVEGTRGAQKFVLDAPIRPGGVAMFWIRTVLTDAVVYSPGCRKCEVLFRPTADPRVLVGECRLEPEVR